MIGKAAILFALFTFCYADDKVFDRTDKKFQDSCLKEHNALRTIHHSPNLKTNHPLIEHAITRCKEIAESKDGNNPGANNMEFGENRYWSSSSTKDPPPCKEATENWYKKANGYNYKKDGPSATFGFTQLIWKETTTLGCARCFHKDGNRYKSHIVCSYKPRGNYKNKFKDNVLEP